MNDNPNWKTLLDVIPPEFHPAIKPVLAEWDKGVSEKINTLHQTYEPFKPFVEKKIPPQIIDQALDVYGQLSDDPAKFVKRVDEVMNLNLFTAPPVQQAPANNQGTEFDEDEFEGVDVTKHPVFKQVLERLDTLQNDWQKSQQETEQEKQIREFEEYLDGLEEEHKESGGFNRKFVTALMTQGVSGEDAVKEWQDTVAAALGNDPNVQQVLENQNIPQGQGSNSDEVVTPPNVMGSGGTAGGGMPDEAINPADIKDQDLEKMVAEMLRQGAEGG